MILPVHLLAIIYSFLLRQSLDDDYSGNAKKENSDQAHSKAILSYLTYFKRDITHELKPSTPGPFAACSKLWLTKSSAVNICNWRI